MATPRSAFERLLPAGVAVVEVSPPAACYPLREEERVAIAGAVPKRRREFAAGRHCARLALAQLGVAAPPLLPGPDRMPRWPAGIAGSISHTEDACVAAVARMTAVRSLGVDIEPEEPLEPELWASICTATERAWLDRQPAGDQGRLVRLIFSAKEAAYKCQYPITGAMLDFLDVELSLEIDDGRFTADAADRAAPYAPILRATRGAFSREGRMIRTAAVLSA